MAEAHIVKSFDEQLNKLYDLIARMGGLAEANLAGALRALGERDADLADRVNAADDRVDALEKAVQDQVIRLLALRAPVADDLRTVITALRSASALERIADHAANTARRSVIVSQGPVVPAVRGLIRMGQLVSGLLKEAVDSYIAGDADRAKAIWHRDREVDDLYSSLFRELLTYMMEDPRNITSCIHLLFIAKNIERIGDHITTIAEMTYFQVTAKSLSDRPKMDTSLQSHLLLGEFNPEDFGSGNEEL